MAELSPRDRLQPFLLDRLTDEQPEAKQESRDRRSFSPKQIQGCILRDLGWLLNAKAHPIADGLEEFPQVAKSVLNYGIQDFAGSCISSVDVHQLERMVVEALRNFEPRLMSHTLSVRLLTEAETHSPNIMAFEIKGEIIANPLSDPLYIKTEIDLETGQFALKDRAHG